MTRKNKPSPIPQGAAEGYQKTAQGGFLSRPVSISIPLLLLLFGQASAKWGSSLSAESGALISYPHLISYAFLIIRGLIWILILERIPLIFAYSVYSIQFVLVVLLGVVFFSEKLSPAQVFGTLLILGGVFFCGLGEGKKDD